MSDEPVLMGIHRHYKGQLYLVLGLGHDANADTLTVANSPMHWDEDNYRSIPLGERTIVVYIGLQLDGAHLGPRLAVRTLADFTAEVCVQPEHRHYGSAVASDDPCKRTRRFSYLGPTLTAEMTT